MIQNGNWGWAMIYDLDGNVVKKEDIKFLPIYTGVEGEEKQGLCVGTENYICINSKVSEADQKASEKFLEWLFNSESGKAYCNGILGMIPPFSTFGAVSSYTFCASTGSATIPNPRSMPNPIFLFILLIYQIINCFNFHDMSRREIAALHIV